jgi:hypothetical protein
MKKILIVVLVMVGIVGCTKDDIFIEPAQQVKPELQIQNSVGIKLESPFVTTEVAMNVKSEVAQKATIKIFDIANKVVSKEELDVKVGDNILKVYTKALPSSAYRIGIYNVDGSMIGITDFNKL